MVAGVGGALAHRWRIDPILVRVGFVVLCLFGGLGLMVYGVGWLLLPDADGQIHGEEILGGRFTPGAVGGLVVLLIGIFSIGPVWAVGDGPSVGGLIALASLVLVILLLLHAFGVIGNDSGTSSRVGGRVDLTKRGSAGSAGTHTWQVASPSAPHGTPVVSQPVDPPNPPQAPKPLKQSPPRRRGPGTAGTTLATGLALLVAGAVVASRDALPTGTDVDAVAWAAVLGVLALTLVVVGLSGRRSGGIGWLAAIAAVVALVNGLAGGTSERFFDDATWTPTVLNADGATFQLATGSAVLDLTDLDVAASASAVPELDADVSIGELKVLVPDDLAVELDTAVGLGDLSGAPEGGSRIGATGPVDLVLNLNVGIGDLEIEEVSR